MRISERQKRLWPALGMLALALLGWAPADARSRERLEAENRTQATDASGWDSLDEQFERLVPFGFSGALLVMEPGKPAHAAGFGFANWETRRPNDAETVFDIGSLSKQFTAAATLLMAERGLLSLDHRIDKYLPYVPEDKREITIHHLLTHTSGLPEFHAFGAGDVHGDFLVMTRDGAERAIMGSPLDFPPGDGWMYSNSGYTLLAAIVERASDRPFETVLRSDLFEPAGMVHTGLYFDSLWEKSTVAHGYQADRDQGSPLDWTRSDELWSLIGGGGILSTATDLARWNRALQEGSVLPRQAVERLFTPHVQVRDGLHYGYGWYIEDGVVRHGGANDFGFASRWRRYQAGDLLLVLLMNREPPGMDVSIGTSAIEQLLVDVVQDRTASFPPAFSRMSGDLDRYVGRYRIEGEEVIVELGLDGIMVEPRGPTTTRHLAFPTASKSELKAIAELDRKARDIVTGMIEGDYTPLGKAMGGPSGLDRFSDYIAGWWAELEAAGADRDDVRVIGTVPSWWSSNDDQLATVIVAAVGDNSGAFRLHWRDGRITGLGGGAVREPVSTPFALTEAGDFLGYHLGIRLPVRLSFRTDATGRTTGLRLETAAGPLVGDRIGD